MASTPNNTLLRQTEQPTDQENAQNPCYFGIYVTEQCSQPEITMIDDQNIPQTPQIGLKFHLISIQPIPAKIGYTEWVDTTSFLTFRSILLQQQPTSCVLYTTHDLGTKIDKRDYEKSFQTNQASAKYINSVENELILANCPVFRELLDKHSTEQQNVNTILQYLFPPKSLPLDDHTMSDSTKKSTHRVRSIYSEEQINLGFLLCKQTLGNLNHNFPNSGPLSTGIYYQTLKKYIIEPLKEFQREEQSLASYSGQQSRSKLIKFTKNALQLPMKYLFYIIQPTTKLRIDQNTLNSIGVFPAPTESNKATTSLFGLLNHCQTTFGSRLLQSWLKQPLLDVYELNQRHLSVGCFVQSTEILTKLRGSLKGIADIEKILAKLNKYYAQTSNGTNSSRVTSVMSGDIIKELLSLYSFLGKMRTILMHLSSLNANSNDGKDGIVEGGNGTSYKDEDELYDFVDEKFTIMNQRGEEEVHTVQKQVLKPDSLLTHSLNMTPNQFINIKYTRELNRILGSLEQYQNLIQTTIDLDAAANHEYLIKADITEELSDISNKKAKVYRALQRLHQEAVSHLRTDSSRVKMMYTNANDTGYYLRVTRKDEKLIRAESETYSVIETRKDGVRFTTNNFRKLSQQYQEEISRYQLAQAITCLQILDAGMTYSRDFYDLMTIVAELDVLSSFSHLVESSPRKYIRPQLISQTGISIGPTLTPSPSPISSQSSDSPDQLPQKSNSTGGHIILNAARHPTIEAQPHVVFIPNDVYLKHGETELQLITGPNMGGKSCYLRMAALIVLMAQVGCYVPCDSASICLVDCILARVGAGDMQLKGVSTFMKEMLETGEILTHGTANSLIVVDELGRGTSTYDGFGLAWGIAEYLATRVHSYTLFATHFHEMTAMSEQFKTVSNKHVTALTGEDSITMLYKVQEGHCDRSFGIHVAQMANFPQEIIKAARKKADSLEAYAQQNLLQMNLPYKYGDEVVHQNRISEDQILAMDEENEDIESIKPVNGSNNGNSFALATTPFRENLSKDILNKVFNNNDFLQLLSMGDIQNANDLNNKQDGKFKQIIGDVYNDTVANLIANK